MHYPGDVDADPAPGGQESPPGRSGLPWPPPGDGDRPVAAGTPGEPYAGGYRGADPGGRVTGSGHADSGYGGYGDSGYGDGGYGSSDSYGSSGYGSGAPYQGAATPGAAAAARILYGAAGGTAGKGPVRGFPPAPGQSAPVYPAGQFSAWNTSPAGTRPGRPDGSAGTDAWPVAASAEHGYAEPDYAVLAVSDPAADATATQTWAVVDDRTAGGWQDPGARGDAPPGRAGPSGASSPGADPSGASRPGASPSGASQPGADPSGASRPGASRPGADRPGAGRRARGRQPRSPAATPAAAAQPAATATPGAATRPAATASPASQTTATQPAVTPAAATPATAPDGPDADAGRGTGAAGANAAGATDQAPPRRAAGPAGDQPGRPRGSARGRRGRKPAKRGRVLLAAAVALIVVAGSGTYFYLAARQQPSHPAAAPAASQPAGPTAQPSPTPSGRWGHIQTRRADPQPLTIAELYPAGFSSTGSAYSRTAARSGKHCAAAVLGSRLQSAVRAAGCTQVMRASYLSGNRKLMGTIGVLNLRTARLAGRAGRAAGPSEFIAQLRGAKGPTRNLTKGTGIEEAEVKGHYLILIWAEFANLHAPKGAAKKHELEQFCTLLLANTANVSLSQRLVTGTPP
jgi:hypothetical protein